MAVNPDRHLRELAAERGWPVQDFPNPAAAGLAGCTAGLAAGVTTAAAAVATGRGPCARSAPGQAALAEDGRDLVLGQAAGGQGAAQAAGPPRPARSSRRAGGRARARPSSSPSTKPLA